MKSLKIAFIFLMVISSFYSCQKEYSVENGNSNVISGKWQFLNNSTQYTGNMDSAYIKISGNSKVLTLTGKSLNGQENFSIHLFTADSFTVSTYSASLSQSEFDYFTSSNPLFTGDLLAGVFTVTITSLSGNVISGTFAGVARDSTGAQTPITLGSFTSTIDLSNNTGGTNIPQSVGTLGANPDTCSPMLISGVYTQGVALSSSNTVQVQVSVTIPGAYIIATNSVNGVNFVNSGTFTATGIQTIILTGSGIPQSQGIQYYSVTYGNSNCSFAINFLPGTVPTGDYFPTTITSNWAYGLQGGSPSDSIFNQVITYAPTFDGNLYSTFITESIPPSGFPDSAYYRKSGNDYYTYVNAADFLPFDSPVFAEYVFLNDQAPQGTIFRSATFSGTIGGLPVSGFVQTTISEKGVPATIGALSFSDVIKVNYEYYSAAAPTIPVGVEEKWYARGVGLIYDNIDDGNFIYNIGRYTVL